MKKSGTGFRPRTVRRVHTAARASEPQYDDGSAKGADGLHEMLLPHEDTPHAGSELFMASGDLETLTRMRAESFPRPSQRRMTFGRSNNTPNSTHSLNIDHPAALPRLNTDSAEHSGCFPLCITSFAP
jgi:hypothetical protein